MSLRRFLGVATIVFLFRPGFASAAQEGLEWQPNIETARNLSAESGRLILIHFGRPDCKPCRNLEENVFSKPGFGAELVDDFVATRVEPGTDRSNLAGKYRVDRVPTDVVLDSRGTFIAKLPCPSRGADYIAGLRKIAAEHGPAAQRLARSDLRDARPGSDPIDRDEELSGDSRYSGQANRDHESTGLRDESETSERYSERRPRGDSQSMGREPDDVKSETRRGLASRRSRDSLRERYRRGESQDSAETRPEERAESDATASTPSSDASEGRRRFDSRAASSLRERYRRGETASSKSSESRPASAQDSDNADKREPGLSGRIEAEVPESNPPGAEIDAPKSELSSEDSEPASAKEPEKPTSPSDEGPSLEGAQDEPQAGVEKRRLPKISPDNPPLGLEGYCPVTLVEARVWHDGDVLWGAIHRKRTYLFVSQEARDKFLKDPDRYSPVFSGFDPVAALENNAKIAGSKHLGVFFEDRVYLFSSEETRSKFEKSPELYAGRIRQALRERDARSKSRLR